MNKIPNFNFKTENKNIIFTAKNAMLHRDNESSEINNIKLTVNNKILIEFYTNSQITDDNYKITFKSDDGWDIEIKNCIWIKNNETITMSAIELICEKGDRNQPLVKNWCLIENLEIKNDITDFEIPELVNLKLFKSPHELFPNVTGYLNINDTPQVEADEIFENFYFLFKLYSGGTSNLRIRFYSSQDNMHCRFNVSLHDLDFKSNYNSLFNVGENNIFNYINSSYSTYIKLKEKNSRHINSIIHNTSLLMGNNEDLDLLIGFVLLEIYASEGDFIKDEKNLNLKNKIKYLLKRLNLCEEKINLFFKQHIGFSKQFLNFIKENRDDMFHGQEIETEKLTCLLNTFLIIIALKMLNINCKLYLPLLNNIINTSEFIRQFENSNLDENELYKFEDVEIVKLNDGEYYLPLDFLNELNIDWNDGKYKVISFKSMSNDEKCKQKIKFNKIRT